MQFIVGNSLSETPGQIGQPLLYQTRNVTNPHWLVVGGSGDGKSHQLRRIATLAARENQGVRVYLLDVHGDLVTDNSLTSTVRFSEVAPFGINPLTINSDPEYGGVRRRANSFSLMMRKYAASKPGERQVAVIRNLITDLCASRGIVQDDPKTWNGEPPTLSELEAFARQLFRQLYPKNSKKRSAPLNLSIAHLLEELGALSDLAREYRTEKNDSPSAEAADACRQAFAACLEEAFAGKLPSASDFGDSESIDIPDSEVRYPESTLQAVCTRLDNLKAMGIFKDTPPDFVRAKPIWRIDLQPLSDEQQGYMVDLYFEKIFLKHKQLGLYDGVRSVIVLDEAHRFVTKESDSIINIAAKEARKFGLMLVFASQRWEHFPKDIIECCASKMILGADTSAFPMLSKKLGIHEKYLKRIVPKKRALVMARGKNSSGTRGYWEISVDESELPVQACA